MLQVKSLRRGDRVVMSFDIGCNKCSFCDAELYSSCATTNPRCVCSLLSRPQVMEGFLVVLCLSPSLTGALLAFMFLAALTRR